MSKLYSIVICHVANVHDQSIYIPVFLKWYIFSVHKKCYIWCDQCPAMGHVTYMSCDQCPWPNDIYSCVPKGIYLSVHMKCYIWCDQCPWPDYIYIPLSLKWYILTNAIYPCLAPKSYICLSLQNDIYPNPYRDDYPSSSNIYPFPYTKDIYLWQSFSEGQLYNIGHYDKISLIKVLL